VFVFEKCCGVGSRRMVGTNVQRLLKSRLYLHSDVEATRIAMNQNFIGQSLKYLLLLRYIAKVTFGYICESEGKFNSSSNTLSRPRREIMYYVRVYPSKQHFNVSLR
jgi:hypothetical protein